MEDESQFLKFPTEQVSALWKSMRPVNLLIIALTMWGVYGAAVSLLPADKISFGMFSLLCIGIVSMAAGGYIFNDIEDVKADEVNRPDSNKIGQALSNEAALKWYYYLTGIGLGAILIVALFYLDISTFGIGVLVAGLLWLYTRYLQKLPLLGNVAVALLCAIAPYMAYHQINLDFIVDLYETEALISEGDFYLSDGLEKMLTQLMSAYIVSIVIPYVIFAFMMTLLRELAKDIEDKSGDAANDYKTFPVLFGFMWSKHLLTALAALSLWLSIEMIKRMLYEPLPPHVILVAIFFVFVPILIALFKAMFMRTPKGARKLSRWLKFVMFLGLSTCLFFIFSDSLTWMPGYKPIR